MSDVRCGADEDDRNGHIYNDLMEFHVSWRNDQAALFCSGHTGLAVQVEEQGLRRRKRCSDIS